MPELLLLRHGKSARPAGVDDFDRPLKDRGVRDCRRIAAWLCDHARIPDLTVSSPAKRAADTAETTLRSLDLAPGAIRHDDRLYHAVPQTLMTVIREFPDSAARALVVGHNPGLERLLGDLAGGDPSFYPDNRRMPTAALAVLRFSVDWRNVADGCIIDAALIHPRQLPK